MAKTAAQLRVMLEAAERRVERLERAVCPPDAVSSAFPLGRVGGSGRHVVRLNARRGATLERIVDAAVALPIARARVATLRRRIAAAESKKNAAAAPAPKRTATLPEAERQRLQTIARYALHGGADERPPFPFERKEQDRAVRLYSRGVLSQPVASEER